MINIPTIFLAIFIYVTINACSSGGSVGQIPNSPQKASANERDGSIDLSWEAVDGALIYRIYWSDKEQFSIDAALGTHETDKLSFTHEKLGNGKTYYYILTANNHAGESIESLIIAATPRAHPSQPTEIMVTERDKVLSVHWQKPLYAESYEVTVATNSDLVDATIYKNIESPFEISDLVNGENYFISLKALNSIGESEASPIIEAIPTKNYSLNAGYQHNCAIKSDHSLWCWGDNKFGQIGNGNFSQYPVTEPVKVETDENVEWILVTGGDTSTCAIDTNQQLWCWGENTYSQLGNDTKQNSASPVRIPGDAQWKTVDSGPYRNCGIQSEGSLWCWGWYVGEEIFNTETSISKPKQLGIDTDWQSVSLGNDHGCGLKTNNTMWCWGSIVGSPDNTVLTKPTQITNDSDWHFISAGFTHTCAIKISGSLWCWGNNTSGQIGNNQTDIETFVNVPKRISDDTYWLDVSTGISHTCALKNDHSLWCWGDNEYGQLGNNSQNRQYKPHKIGNKKDWVNIVAEADHSCASNRAGNIYCWGLNYRAELGIGGTPRLGFQDSYLPILTNDSTDWLKIAVGYEHSCAYNTSNSIFCWGSVFEWQPGFTVEKDKAIPTEVVGERDWQSVHTSNSGESICGIKHDATLWCWGRGIEGQFGNGTQGANHYSLEPTPVSESSQWQQVALGWTHICAIKLDGSLWCWGETANGKVGIGEEELNPIEPIPKQVGFETDWISIALGERHSCGIRSDNSLWCWGSNKETQLGIEVNDDVFDYYAPTQVDTINDWNTISLGSEHSCGIKLDKTGWCWGDNSYYQTSTSEESVSQITEILPNAKWNQITTGYISTCGIKEDQSLMCWGYNDVGQLGAAHQSPYATPDLVGIDIQWKHVGIGYQHACGIQADNTIWCWGTNSVGALGDGLSWKTTPQLVLFP